MTKTLLRITVLSAVVGLSCAPTSALKRRAEQVWQARVEQDCETQFLFEDPRRPESKMHDQYVEWCRTKQPFVFKTYQLGRVQTENDMGWVEVRYSTKMRGFDDMAPTDANHWEKWLRLDQQWYPVPKNALETLPAAPAQRETAKERRLRKRLEESYEARRRGDWNMLYELSDPRDHSIVSPEDFAEGEGKFTYLNCRAEWVEVINGRGRTLSRFHYKIADESVTKLEPREDFVPENWVEYESEWYRDLKRQ